jgi:hypothetical protein
MYDEVSESFYDYTSSSHDQASATLKFQHLDIKEVKIGEMSTDYPELMKIVLSLAETSEEDQLTWTKQTYDNGYYVGQTDKKNQRHGRGAYCWTNSQYYIGYWDNGKKNRFGHYLNADMTPFYEGEIQDGLKHGQGTYYFNNGHYKGQFINDIRSGPGTYYWKDGSRWEGQCVNGQLKGQGTHYNQDGSSFLSEYS